MGGRAWRWLCRLTIARQQRALRHSYVKQAQRGDPLCEAGGDIPIHMLSGMIR
jgi:hypothetical protein